jgi:hypothetical protein
MPPHLIMTGVKHQWTYTERTVLEEQRLRNDKTINIFKKSPSPRLDGIVMAQSQKRIPMMSKAKLKSRITLAKVWQDDQS